MLWTSRRVFFAPSASVFWCLNLTGGGACSWGAHAALFCLWNLLTNFLQGLRSALLLMFSEMSPASEQGHNNCSIYPEAHLVILVWMDFPSPEAARQRRTCFFWSWGDCGHHPAWNITTSRYLDNLSISTVAGWSSQFANLSVDTWWHKAMTMNCMKSPHQTVTRIEWCESGWRRNKTDYLPLTRHWRSYHWL